MYNGPGVYRHYKGQHYFVLGTARHSETGEQMVIYVPLYNPTAPVSWPDPHMVVRPLTNFNQQIPKNGERRHYWPWRFEKVQT